jgi:hypothetical protein
LSSPRNLPGNLERRKSRWGRVRPGCAPSPPQPVRKLWRRRHWSSRCQALRACRRLRHRAVFKVFTGLLCWDGPESGLQRIHLSESDKTSAIHLRAGEEQPRNTTVRPGHLRHCSVCCRFSPSFIFGDIGICFPFVAVSQSTLNRLGAVGPMAGERMDAFSGL